jgi:hypothetical protein
VASLWKVCVSRFVLFLSLVKFAVSICSRTMFTHDVSLRFVYHSDFEAFHVSRFEAFVVSMLHDSCRFFMFGSGFVCPGVSRCVARFEKERGMQRTRSLKISESDHLEFPVAGRRRVDLGG